MTNIPCDNDCICVPVCRNKPWTKMVNQCKLLLELFQEIEDELPRGEYAQLYIHAVDKFYRVNKNHDGVVRWNDVSEDQAVLIYGDNPLLVKFSIPTKIWGQKPCKDGK